MSEKTVPGTEHLGAKLNSETLVNMFLSEIESEGLRFDTLDDKAGLILGFGLVRIAELVGFLLLAAAEAHPSRVAVPMLVQVLFYFGMGFLMTGTAFAMLALSPRSFTREASILTRKMVTQAPTVFSVLDSLLSAKQNNAPVLILKGRWTRVGGILVLAGLLSLAMVVLLPFHSLVGTGGTPLSRPGSGQVDSFERSAPF